MQSVVALMKARFVGTTSHPDCDEKRDLSFLMGQTAAYTRIVESGGPELYKTSSISSILDAADRVLIEYTKGQEDYSSMHWTNMRGFAFRDPEFEGGCCNFWPMLSCLGRRCMSKSCKRKTRISTYFNPSKDAHTWIMR